jgi:glucose-1-phosphate thymidylyltransferase
MGIEPHRQPVRRGEGPDVCLAAGGIERKGERVKRKGIVLAGGAGTRLHPLTLCVSKQLLPVYDKPMVYYPLSTLMLAGMREILIISSPGDLPMFQRLMGDGSQWGMELSYAVQASPDGIAQSLVIAAPFLAGSASCLALGDNLIFGHGLTEALRRGSGQAGGATVFAYRVEDPERYGVVAFDRKGVATAIEEKPRSPKSDWAVIGLYFYDETAPDRARRLRPSARGELEITDINNGYLADQRLKVEPLGRGFAWFDAGTHASLLDASRFIQIVQQRQRILIASPEEIAFKSGWISADDLARQAERLGKSEYGKALIALLDRPDFPAT